MAKVPKDLLKATENLHLIKPRIIKAGGVVSLKSYWAAIGLDLWKKIDGRFAKVEAREKDNGDFYLVIVLPFKDGTSKDLRTWCNHKLDEGDEVDIASIVMLFVDNDRGGTDIFYDALWEGNYIRCKEDIIKRFIADKCSELMESIKSSKLKVVKERQGSLYDFYEEEHYGGFSEEDNWYAMTDGMYGDYPEEGFDSDYESIGY